MALLAEGGEAGLADLGVDMAFTLITFRGASLADSTFYFRLTDAENNF